ncbi:MAG TPA: hypothetical protein VGK93_05525 [Candidatus Eisenbacteria bacterium]|jgi:hypothetical protein
MKRSIGFSARRVSVAALVAAALMAATAPAEAHYRPRAHHGPRFAPVRIHHGHVFYGPRVVRVYPYHGYRYYGYPAFCGGPRYYGSPAEFSFDFSITNVPPPGYFYYDPYCEARFSTLGIYAAHLHGHRHPRIVQVLSIDTGELAYACRYAEGGWVSWE